MANNKTSIELPGLVVPTLQVPTLNVPTLTVPKLYTPQLHIQGTPYNVYRPKRNKLERHVRDLGDIILGNPITGTRELEETLIDNGQFFAASIPILNRVVGAADLLQERVVTPIREGQPTAALINGLETLGYSLDILANPVKSLLPWAGGGTPNDFLRSMGWIDGEYRSNYNFNTGNFVLDMAGEIVTDPLNWFSFGGKQAVKSTIGGAVDAAKDTFSKNADEILSIYLKTGDDQAKQLLRLLNEDEIELIFKNAINEFGTEILDNPDLFLKNLLENIELKNETYRRLLASARPGTKRYELLKQITAQYKQTLSPTKLEQFHKLANDIALSDGFKKYRAAAMFKNKVTTVEQLLAKAGWTLSGIGIPAWVVKHAIAPGFEYVWNKAIMQLNNYDASDITDHAFKKARYIEEIVSTYSHTASYSNNPVTQSLDKLLEHYQINRQALSTMWIESFNELSRTGKVLDEAEVDNLFLKKLQRKIPVLKLIWSDTKISDLPDDIVKIFGKENIVIDNINTEAYNMIKPLLIDTEVAKFYLMQHVVSPVKESGLIHFVVKDTITKQLEVTETAFAKALKQRDVDTLDTLLHKVYTDFIDLNLDEEQKALLKRQIIKKELDIKDRYSKKLADIEEAITLKRAEYNEANQSLRELKIKYPNTRYGNKKVDTQTLKVKKIRTELDTLIEQWESTMDTMNRQLTINEEILKKRSAPYVILNLKSYRRVQQIRKYNSAMNNLAREFDAIGITEDNVDYIGHQLSLLFDTDFINNMPSLPSQEEIDLLAQYKAMLNMNPKELEKARKQIINSIKESLLEQKYNASISKGIFPTVEVPLLPNTALEESTAEVQKELDKWLDAHNKIDIPKAIDLDSKQVKQLLIDTENYRTKNIRGPIVSVFGDSDEAIQDTLNILDQAFDYEDESPSVLINRILNNKLASATDLENYGHDLELLRRQVNKWNAMFKRGEFNKDIVLINKQGLSTSVKDITNIKHAVADLYSTFNTKKYDATLKRINDAVGISNRLYVQVVPKAKRLQMQADAFKRATKIFEQLQNPDSGYSEMLKEIQRYCSEHEELQYLHNYITNVFVTAQSYYNQYKLFNPDFTELFLKYDFKEIAKVNDTVFVKNFFEKSILDIALEIQDIGHLDLLDSEALIKKLTDRYMDFAGYSLRIDALKNVESSMYKDIEKIVHGIYSDYIYTQRKILNNNGLTTGKLIYSINSEFISNIKGFEDIITELLEAKKNGVPLSDSLFINLFEFATVTLDPDKINFNEFLDTIQSIWSESSPTLNKLTQIIQESHDNFTVTKDFYEQLANISKQNDIYAGAEKVEGLRHAIRYIDGNTLMDLVDNDLNTTVFTNVRAYSIATGISFTKVYDPFHAERLGILPTNLLDKNGGPYDKFYYLFNKWNSRLTKYKASENTVRNLDLISLKRNALTEFFKTYEPWFMPKDIFVRMQADNFVDYVLSWDALLLDPTFDPVVARNYRDLLSKYAPSGRRIYTATDRALYLSSPVANYQELDALFNNGFVDPSDFELTMNKITNMPHEEVQTTIRENLQTYIKDPRSAQKHEPIINQYIQRNVKALNDAAVMDNTLTDTRLVYDVHPEVRGIKLKDNVTDSDIVKQRIAESFGFNKYTSINSPKVGSYLKRVRNENVYESLCNAFTDIKNVRAWVDKTDGYFIFVTKGDYTFNFSPAQLKEYGLNIKQIEDNIWLVRRTDNVSRNLKFDDNMWIRHKDILFEEQQNNMTEAMKNVHAYYMWPDNEEIIPYDLFDGTRIHKSQMDIIETNPKIAEFLGDDVIQKSYRNWDKKGNSNFLRNNLARPNTVIIGAPDAYNTILDYVKEAFETQNIVPVHQSPSLYKTVPTGVFTAIQQADTKVKYMQLLANDDFYLGSEMFRRVFKDATDQEIEQFFSRNNFVAALFKEGKNGQPRVYKIYIRNRKQLEQAIEQGAVCLTHDIYRNATLALNEDLISSKILKFYRRTIVGTFKTIYLSTVGFLMRNGIDSAIVKNARSTEGAASIWENFQYEFKARKLLQEYNDIQARVFKLAEADGNKTFNRYYLQKVFSELEPEQIQRYKLVDLFMNSGASGGLSKAFEDYLLEYNLANKGFDGPLWEQIWNQNFNKFPTIAVIRNANDAIEQSSRLGLFLNLVDHGSDYTAALKKVIDTHFDYTFKSDPMAMLEQIFWFSTFPLNNMLYYINEGLLNNPDMLRLELDLLEQSYNTNGLSYEQVKKSDYLTRQMLSGHIRFYVGTDNKHSIIIKTGSSLFDFFNLMNDPLGEMKDRLNPFLSVLFGYESLSDLNPLSTPTYYAGEQFKAIKNPKEHSFIPSVYSTLKPYKQYSYTYKYNQPYEKYVKSWKRYPKRYYPKTDSYKQLSYKFSRNRYLWAKSPRSKILNYYSKGILPYWYNDFSYKRAIGRLRRRKKKLY